LKKQLKRLVETFREYAQEQAADRTNPKEACGVIVDDRILIFGENIHPEPKDSFLLNPETYLQGTKEGKISYIIHSHIGASPEPGSHDITTCNLGDIPWIIVSTYPELWPDPVILTPGKHELPLEGRDWDYQRVNCYTLVQDYYRKELGITLPVFPPGPTEEEWKRPETNYFEENFRNAGFRRLASAEPLQKGDIIAVQTVSPEHPDHIAVLTDATQNTILHHVAGRLSGYTGYGGYWRNHTRFVVRHIELEKGAVSVD
jgi:proteasome lid subunit RPN8/RPN11